MIEVFKTNVDTRSRADELVLLIESSFGYKAGFDLEDCDRILRVIAHQTVDEALLIGFLKSHGVSAQVLPDEIPDTSASGKLVYKVSNR